LSLLFIVESLNIFDILVSSQRLKCEIPLHRYLVSR
jgi:hypothetical protein